MTSADLFSRVASEYSRYRPTYPAALFEYLAGEAPLGELAWDCGTGNGQAALALTKHFTRVYATDASQQQLALAAQHDRIDYRQEVAEEASLPSASVDLVTVALAVHWFDLARFYSQVRRVLKPAGVLAVWTYHLPRIDPAVDQIIRYYYEQVVAQFWPPGFHFVHERYETLPFPFDELVPPPLDMDAEWSVEQVAGFLASWSATAAYFERTGRHPLDRVWNDLRTAWGAPDRTRPVKWPLHLRAGRWSGAPTPSSP